MHLIIQLIISLRVVGLGHSFCGTRILCKKCRLVYWEQFLKLKCCNQGLSTILFYRRGCVLPSFSETEQIKEAYGLGDFERL